MVKLMKNKIAIIGNGTINDIIFHKNLLQNINVIICADGGANNAKKIGIIPDYIIGYYNSGHYSNTHVDELGIQASTEMNPTLRSKLLQDGFKIAHVEDVFSIPLFSQELLILTSNDIKLSPRADSRFIVSDIEIL